MDVGTGGSQKRKAYTIKVKLTAIAHTIYRKSLLPWYGKLTNDNVLIEGRSPIKAGSLIQAGGRSNLF